MNLREQGGRLRKLSKTKNLKAADPPDENKNKGLDKVLKDEISNSTTAPKANE